MKSFNAETLRADFPILKEKIHGKNLVYFDNAASSQKPLQVIEAIRNYYLHNHAGVHRGVHTLSERATQGYELAREKVRAFINAKNVEEIIFVRGATEAINLVASSFGELNLTAKSKVLISFMEHHSNIVPWQQICRKKSAQLSVVNVQTNGELDLEDLEMKLTHEVKILALTHVSNTLGTINPLKKIISLAHAKNIPVLIDGAQAVPHLKVDVEDLDADFYVFSGHKMYGPTGIGVLYAKTAQLEHLPPYQTGGGMINQVSFENTTFADLPTRFEAGSPNTADAIGLAAAIDYLETIGMENIAKHEEQLLLQANALLNTIKGLKIIGQAAKKAGVISFTLDNLHPHDLATILDTEGIAIRAGHHCNMPLMNYFGVAGTSRISFGLYNTLDEIEVLKPAIEKAQKLLL